MPYKTVGYKIKYGDYPIRICSGIVETTIYLWYYRKIRKLGVIMEEFFVHTDNLP